MVHDHYDDDVPETTVIARCCVLQGMFPYFFHLVNAQNNIYKNHGNNGMNFHYGQHLHHPLPKECQYTCPV